MAKDKRKEEEIGRVAEAEVSQHNTIKAVAGGGREGRCILRATLHRCPFSPFSSRPRSPPISHFHLRSLWLTLARSPSSVLCPTFRDAGGRARRPPDTSGELISVISPSCNSSKPLHGQLIIIAIPIADDLDNGQLRRAPPTGIPS